MRKKIVLLPLDERPCNYDFPVDLFRHDDLNLVRPSKLGNKKEPANVDEIAEYLKEECKDADGLILSVDMLLYGGLIPSRLHYETIEKLKQTAETIKHIKDKNPGLTVFAFQVIMRCPAYSSDDEEPEYYDKCGETIHLTGEIVHKSRLGLCGENGMQGIMPDINQIYLNDYIGRREINRAMNLHILKYLKEGYIDFLVIPQDDSATYGYAAMDRDQICAEIEKRNLSDRILVYPGADEVALTLMTRMINRSEMKKPKVYVKYACEMAKNVIPLYEGSTLSGTVKYHILSAGCQLTDCYETADIILVLTAPAGTMKEAAAQPCNLPGYRTERNLAELIDFIKDRTAENRVVTIADNAYANGGDLEFIKMMDNNQLLMKVAGYAGWNTSANTIGTALAEGVDALYFGNSNNHRNFLVKRYIEDAGYCSVVRKNVTEKLSGLGMNYFDVKEKDGAVSQIVEQELRKFMKDYCSSIASKTWIDFVYMPWKRMFEIGLSAGIEEISNG